MGGWSLWMVRVLAGGAAALGATVFLLLVEPPRADMTGYALRPLAHHLAAGGLRVREIEAGVLAVEGGDLLVHILQDSEDTLLLVAISPVTADTVGWKLINEWNRDTTLVKIFAGEDGLVAFEAALPSGASQSPEAVAGLLEHLLNFVHAFLTAHLETASANESTEI